MLAGNRKKERLRGGKGREGGSNWVRGETTNVEITDATPTKRRRRPRSASVRPRKIHASILKKRRRRRGSQIGLFYYGCYDFCRVGREENVSES